MGEAKRTNEAARREFEAQDDTHKLGDAPVDEAYIKDMTAVMTAVDAFFNGKARGADRKVGIVMLVFPYANETRETGRCNFMSNGADRKDIVCLFKEMIARFEGQPEMRGTA